MDWPRRCSGTTCLCCGWRRAARRVQAGPHERAGSAGGDRDRLALRLPLLVHPAAHRRLPEPAGRARGREPRLPVLRAPSPPLLQLRLVHRPRGTGPAIGGVRLTLVHPCIGRQPGRPYIRTWQMEPLPPALIAGLTPRDIEVRFYDDRMEGIP